jgi:hypothetical protein
LAQKGSGNKMSRVRGLSISQERHVAAHHPLHDLVGTALLIATDDKGGDGSLLLGSLLLANMVFHHLFEVGPNTSLYMIDQIGVAIVFPLVLFALLAGPEILVLAVSCLLKEELGIVMTLLESLVAMVETWSETRNN